MAWEAWWEANGDTILAERAARHRGPAASSPPAATFAALAQAAGDAYFETRAAAYLGLARCPGGDPERATLLIRAGLRDCDLSAAGAACLALGLRGSADAIPTLASIMNDSLEGRLLTARGDRRPIAPRLRAHAAVAIGLIGRLHPIDQTTRADLRAMLGELRRDAWFGGSLLALSLAPDPDARGALEALVADDTLNPGTRAIALTTIGHLGERSAVPFVIERLSTDTIAPIRQSAAIALRRLATTDDERRRDALLRSARAGNDQDARHFATLALAAIPSAPVWSHLRQEIAAGTVDDRCFAALALGLRAASDSAARPGAIADLRTAWDRCRHDGERAALAIGLGLADDEASAADLLATLRTTRSASLQGQLAMALGLLGSRDALPFVRQLATDPADSLAQRRALIALGLAGDVESAPLLVATVTAATDPFNTARGGAALGLGFLRGPPEGVLLRAAADRSFAFRDDARAFAAVALGLMADPLLVTPLRLLRTDANYLAFSTPLHELSGVY